MKVGTLWVVAVALTCMGWSLESGGGRCITLDQPMTRVPVSGAPVLWLGFRVLRPAEVLDRLPWVRVVRQEGGFGCRIQSVELLGSRLDPEGKVRASSYEIKISWTPGADLSGCLIRLEDPGGGAGSHREAEVFMSF